MKTVAMAAATVCCLSTACLADAPSRRVPPIYAPPTSVFSWTGFYAGLNAGYTFNGNTSYSIVGNTPVNAGGIASGARPGFASTRADGFAGGGQIGYNHEFDRGILAGLGSGFPGGRLVAGLEGDAAYTDLRKQTIFGPGVTVPIAGSVSFNSSTGFLGTVRGRLGLALGNLLVFGSGGFADGGINDGAHYFVGNTGVINYSGAASTVRPGYAFGGGLDYASSNLFGSSAITLKAEHLHFDLGATTLFLPNLFGSINSYTLHIHNDGDLVHAGINYKFDLVPPTSIVARQRAGDRVPLSTATIAIVNTNRPT